MRMKYECDCCGQVIGDTQGVSKKAFKMLHGLLKVFVDQGGPVRDVVAVLRPTDVNKDVEELNTDLGRVPVRRDWNIPQGRATIEWEATY